MISLLSLLPSLPVHGHEQLVAAVFSPGEAGYKAFRIPGILGVNETLLAFAEGRKYGCEDFAGDFAVFLFVLTLDLVLLMIGQHDVVCKKSRDGGRTWGELTVLLDPHKLFGSICSNESSASDSCEFWDPTPVFDRDTGNVIMMTTLSLSESDRMHGRMTAWTMTSEDLGNTWGTPRNITEDIYSQQWGVGTPSNGHGIQLMSGRLLMPAYVRNAPGPGQNKCFEV